MSESATTSATETDATTATTGASDTTTQTTQSTETSATSTTTESGATDGKTQTTEGEDSPKTGAPEEYADFDIPEGVTVDPDALAAFKTTAKEIGLTQEQAQQLTAQGAAMAQRIQEQAVLAHTQRVAEWETQTRNDSEIGGDKLAENLAVVPQVLKTFGSEALVNFLDETGIGNHPEVVKLFVKVGKAIAEDTLLPGGSNTPGGEKSLAQTLYPNMNP